MKLIYRILFLTTILVVSCKDDSYFYEEQPETVDMSVWDYLKSDNSHKYFCDLVSIYHLMDEIESNNPITMFIPKDEDLMELDTANVDMKSLLSYMVVPTLANIQTMTSSSKIQTLLDKFALLEYNSTDAQYFYDGTRILNSSPLFNDGRFYVLDDVVFPAPNLYEYFALYNPVFKDYIDIQDSTYFDVDLSTPIDFSLEGTVYDSVFTTENLFYKYYFGVDEESRYSTATFVLFTQEQLASALEIVKEDLDINEIPTEWKNNILLPSVITSSIFENSLQFSEFEEEMKNIQGVEVSVDVDNIDEDSRYICSNGIIYNMKEFYVPEELYKEPEPVAGNTAVYDIIEGDKWGWSSNVIVEGLEGYSDIEPKLVYPDEGALNSSVLVLDCGLGFDGTFKITFTQEGIFGAEKYRLLWSGSSTYCGLYKIYVNGELLQMRNYAGIDKDYFDSYEFRNTVIKGVTGNGNYQKVGNFNIVDFAVTNISEYGDVEVTFEYIGPSVDGQGNIRQPGIVIDYFKLEIYE